jgi:hypothetical protein|tara:strand:- start:51 stop:494 length:444 start_codon:yes stop_codon:yes gene_type:complete
MGYFPKEWLVFFYDPPLESWYHRFRRGGMAHCGMFAYDHTKNVWIIIEHIHKRLDVKVLSGEEISYVIQYVLQNKGVILKCPLQRNKFKLFQGAWLRENSCVTVIMRVLGINRLIITPYGLYKYLVDNGCKKWEYLEHQNIENQQQK